METLSELDELYVVARRVLLDAVEALGSHREAIVLVGAQACQARPNPVGAGIQMAIRSAGVLVNPEEIAASCQALASDLLAALG